MKDVGVMVRNEAMGDAAMDELAARIHEVRVRTGFAYVMEVGGLIMDRLYGGDFAAFHARHGKQSPLRQLAGRPGAGLSASHLDKLVNVYELLMRHPQVATMRHVGPTHVLKVLPGGGRTFSLAGAG